MNGENKNGMQCSEFDLLLADAIDRQLTGEQLSRFEQHQQSCQPCSAMFADVKAGVNWLEQVEEVEPPRHLVHNILVATSGVTERVAAKVERHERQSLGDRLREIFVPVFAPMFTRRFAMTAAGAFFSVTLALNAGGIKLSKLDFSPRNLSRTYYATEERAMKYYEQIGLVYEIESRVQELRRAAGAAPDKDDNKKPPKKNESDKSQENEPERHEQNYSQTVNELIEAHLDDSGIGIIARQRRIS